MTNWRKDLKNKRKMLIERKKISRRLKKKLIKLLKRMLRKSGKNKPF
jgi:hypothetical protein